MEEKDFLLNYLKNSKEAYEQAKKPEELARRLEWSVVVSEEAYQEEIARSNHINTLVSSLLIASSFLIAGFIQFVTSLTFDDQSKIALFFVIAAGSLAMVSVLLQLFLIIYKKRARNDSVCGIVTTYLDKDTSFANPYSENFGRLLMLNDMFADLKKKNNFLAKVEVVSTAILATFLILFFVCFFVTK